VTNNNYNVASDRDSQSDTIKLWYGPMSLSCRSFVLAPRDWSIDDMLLNWGYKTVVKVPVYIALTSWHGHCENPPQEVTDMSESCLAKYFRQVATSGECELTTFAHEAAVPFVNQIALQAREGNLSRSWYYCEWVITRQLIEWHCGNLNLWPTDDSETDAHGHTWH